VAYKLIYEYFRLLAAILDFLTPLVSGTMEDGAIELLNSENGGGVAVEMLFLSLTHLEVLSGVLLPPPPNYHIRM
jgi:hypothetical protein